MSKPDEIMDWARRVFPGNFESHGPLAADMMKWLAGAHAETMKTLNLLREEVKTLSAISDKVSTDVGVLVATIKTGETVLANIVTAFNALKQQNPDLTPQLTALDATVTAATQEFGAALAAAKSATGVSDQPATGGTGNPPAQP